MKKLLSLALGLGLGLLALDLHAAGYSQSQVDTNALMVASTNTYTLPDRLSGAGGGTILTNGQVMGSQAYIDCGYANDAWLEVGGYFTNSTANSSNVTFRIAATVDFANWTNNYTSMTLVVPGSQTNWCSSIVRLANAPPGLAVRACENANTGVIGAYTNTIFFKVVQKPGT